MAMSVPELQTISQQTTSFDVFGWFGGCGYRVSTAL
jgi:hypothetical protein